MRTTMWMAAGIMAVALPVTAQDKAAEVMQETRAALGGARLDRITALAIEGPFAREMGNRQVQGQIELTLQLPGNLHRSEDTEMMGGMSIERISALKGDVAWEDMQNRGGMGGGMQIVMRQGPPGQELNAEQIEQARVRRSRNELNRYLLAFLGGATLAPTYVAVAEAPDGKADVVEVKNENGQATRLFIDQATHMPLMLQYQEMRPRINLMGGPGAGPGGRGGRGRGGAAGAPGAPGGGQRPDPEEVRRRMENMPPPEPSTVTLYLGDYKQVDGVMFPHRLSQAVDGKTVDEWTIEKIRINPDLKADFFDKK